MTQEAALIQRAARGDPEAFDALVGPHLTQAYRAAYLITHDPEAAADAVQEALLRPYRSLANAREGHPFSPWFVRIVVNEALKQGSWYRKALRLQKGMLPGPVPTPTPSRPFKSGRSGIRSRLHHARRALEAILRPEQKARWPRLIPTGDGGKHYD